MARSIMAGMTDYSHQSFKDLVEDMNYWKTLCADRVIWIDENIEKLEKNNYWKKIPVDFQSDVYYSRKFFNTVVEELTMILNDIEYEVKENHTTRLYNLANVADKENKDIGRSWHGNYEYGWKEYGNSDFRIVEDIYGHTRDLVASLTDLSNIAFRLKDFIGIMKKEESGSKSILNSAQFGDNVTVNVGDYNTITTTNIKVTKGNFEELKKMLKDNGVEESDIDELKTVLENDTPDNEKKSFGAGVSEWIGKMVTKASLNVWKIGIGAAGSLLAQALNQYYGWI